MSRLRKALRVDARTIEEAIEDGSYGTPGLGWWGQGMTWTPSASSGGVTSAMRLSAVWACIRLVTDAISTLPMDVYVRDEGARLPFTPRPRYLDFRVPGPTRVQYLTEVVMSLLTDGNAFVATPRDRFGVVQSLTVLDPARVTVDRQSGRVVFRIGGSEFSDLDVMHVAGLRLPGSLRGLSPIGAARDIVDAAAAAQTAGKSHFSNASVPPAVIKVPPSPGGALNQGGTDGERAKRIAQAWHETHGGTSNAGKVGVLIGGAELQSVAINNRDSQWIEARQFGIQEIARIYGVPPHLIADASNSTSWGSGLAEQNLAFGQFALRPWIERIEDAHDRLLASEGLPGVFLRLNLDALLRAAAKDRYEAHATGIAAGFLTVDEARELEDLRPLRVRDSGTTREGAGLSGPGPQGGDE